MTPDQLSALLAFLSSRHRQPVLPIPENHCKQRNYEYGLKPIAGHLERQPLVSLMDHIVTTHHTFCRQEVAQVGSLFKGLLPSTAKIILS